MSKITNIELSKIIMHVYWSAFDDGRMLGKDKSPSMKEFRRAKCVGEVAMKDIRKLIKKSRSVKP